MDPDIFGIAFNDYLSGNKGEFIQIDCNVADTSYLPVAYFFRNFEMMPEGEQKIMEACKGSVLDVGAGAGSHAIYLQKKRCDVMAVDFSKGAVKAMKKRGVEKAVCIDFFDMKEKRFDNILFLMNGAGIARTVKGLYKLLDHAKTLLNTNGLVFIESTDIIYMFEKNDGSLNIDPCEKYYGEVTYKLKYKGFDGKKFKWLFIDRDNLSYIAGKTGFNPQMFYDAGKYNFIMKLTPLQG